MTRLFLDGATITLDYGTPLTRGREIWGTVVRDGPLWRSAVAEAGGGDSHRTVRSSSPRP